MISVIICTYKRSEKAEKCLSAFQRQKYKNFEILLIDQNENRGLNKKIKNNRTKIKYFHIENKGLSYARNFGIKMAAGNILVFTDDDCFPDKNWLKEINISFQKHREITAIFGRTLPYQAEKNEGLICPCLFDKEKEKIITKPCRHWEEIGFGNNMAFRRKVFEKIGGFKEWLGVGSIGYSCEDGEFALRLLLKDYKILYNPKLIVYHNRWLKKNSNEWRKQLHAYACGEIAGYGFYAFKGEKLAQEVVWEHFRGTMRNVYSKLRKAIKNLSLAAFREIILDIYYDFYGLLLAFWFAKF